MRGYCTIKKKKTIEVKKEKFLTNDLNCAGFVEFKISKIFHLL